MRTPDFLVVGAARSGTTSLHSYLSQHEEIYLPGLKEPCFFAFDGDKKKFVNGKFAFAVRDFEGYERLFEDAGKGQKLGEMSTPYLYLYEKSIATMKKYFTDYAGIKIVIMLRNPPCPDCLGGGQGTPTPCLPVGSCSECAARLPRTRQT